MFEINQEIKGGWVNISEENDVAHISLELDPQSGFVRTEISLRELT